MTKKDKCLLAACCAQALPLLALRRLFLCRSGEMLRKRGVPT